MRVLLSHGCIVDWAYLRIHRAFTTLDMSLVHLYPKVNYTRMLQQYFENAKIRSLEALFTRRMFVRAMDAYRTSYDIHDRVNEYTMFQGKLVRRHAQLFEGATDKFAAFLAAVVNTAALCLLIVEVGGLVGFLGQHHPAFFTAVGGGNLGAVLEWLPRLDYGTWLVVLGLGGFFTARLLRTGSALQRKDPRQAQRVAPF
jgi:hypothetical protein